MEWQLIPDAHSTQAKFQTNMVFATEQGDIQANHRTREILYSRRFLKIMTYGGDV